MATATDEVNEIRRRMAQIRHELHQDVKEVVEGAEGVTDWRRYVRMYPWAAVGMTFAIGYLVVPKRHRSVPRELVRQAEEVAVRELRESEPEAKKRRKSLMGAALGMIAPLAWRAVQNYAMGYLEQWIALQQQQYLASAGPMPEPTEPSPGQSGRKPPGGPRYPAGPDRPGEAGDAGGRRG